jgi:hypothetical protein
MQPQVPRNPCTSTCSLTPYVSLTQAQQQQQMELAITGHPDTADRLLDDNHANQELFPNLVTIASATGKTSCKVKPSCCLPRLEPVRRYA